MNKKWIELFKIGTHTDRFGKSHIFTTSDLDTIAATYTERLKSGVMGDRAPITKGHPEESGAAAFGWLAEVKVENGVLLGRFDDIVPSFEEEVKNKQYYNRSISLSGFEINHVAFLGADAPAVSGLADFTAYTPPKESAEFSYFLDYGIEDRLRTVKQFFRNIKNYLLKSGEEMADEIISEYGLESLGDIPEWEKREDKEANDTPKIFNRGEFAPTEEEIQFSKEELMTVEELTQQLEVSRTENARLSGELKKMSTQQEYSKYDTALTALVEEGKVTPAEADEKRAEFAALQKIEKAEFSGDDGKSVSLIDMRFAALEKMKGRAPIIDFSKGGKGAEVDEDLETGKSIAASL